MKAPVTRTSALRLVRVVLILASGETLRASELASRLSVSQRTINRDLRALSQARDLGAQVAMAPDYTWRLVGLQVR